MHRTSILPTTNRTVVSSHKNVSFGGLVILFVTAKAQQDDDDDYSALFWCLLMISQFMYLMESDHSRWLLLVYLALSIRCVHAETRG